MAEKINRRPEEQVPINIKSKGRQTKLSCKEIEKALIAQNGLTTKAAEAIGISYFALKQAIRDNPKLVKILDKAEEINLDFAESKLRKMIEKEIPSAVFFYLKCKGKKRGYEEGASSNPMPTKPILFKYVPATKQDIEAANKKKEISE